jgi:hypothetical protein
MAGDPPARVSSRALKEELEWEESRYSDTRTSLIKAGLIKGVIGGPGGSLELTKGAAKLSKADAIRARQEPVHAFVSYSHVDSKIKNDLLKHLEPLRRLGLVSAWHDGEIKPGDEWQKAIADKLVSSRIVLLLISSDFIYSEYCYEKELGKAMERHHAKKAVVVPVIVRPCLWQELSFGKLNSLPDGGRAITLWDNVDEALTNVAIGVRTAAQSLQPQGE